MKELIIAKNDAGQRLDRFISKAVPMLPASLMQKYIRIKRIKVNGKGSKRDYKLTAGDAVQLYVSDCYLAAAGGPHPYGDPSSGISPQDALPSAATAASAAGLDIAYEDANILLLNKKPGVLCYNSDDPGSPDLITGVKMYLREKGEWLPREEHFFAPAVCNRIDRNTSGIVIAAKNAESLRIINDKLKLREIDKYYLAAVHGAPEPQSGTITGYLVKDGRRNLVTVYGERRPDAKEAKTEYKTISSRGGLSLLECRLITGRTHQIRAQLAGMGHPILGDRKYGSRQLDASFAEPHQALCSYKLTFSFKTESGPLSYLNGRTILLENIPFREKYFQGNRLRV